MPAPQVEMAVVLAPLPACAEAADLQSPQPRTSLPQGLSEDALKEALQVSCIWVESQDLQDTRCQEIEREVHICTCLRLLLKYHTQLHLSMSQNLAGLV